MGRDGKARRQMKRVRREKNTVSYSRRWGSEEVNG